MFQFDDKEVQAMAKQELAKQIAIKVQELVRTKYSDLISREVSRYVGDYTKQWLTDNVDDAKLTAEVEKAMQNKLMPILENKFLGAYIQVLVAKARKLAEQCEKTELLSLIGK